MSGSDGLRGVMGVEFPAAPQRFQKALVINQLTSAHFPPLHLFSGLMSVLYPSYSLKINHMLDS